MKVCSKLKKFFKLIFCRTSCCIYRKTQTFIEVKIENIENDLFRISVI